MDDPLAKLVLGHGQDSLDRDKLLESLVALTCSCQDEKTRASVDAQTFKSLAKILDHIVRSCELSHAHIFCEAFRFLRNAMVGCQRNQTAARDAKLFDVVHGFLQNVTESSSHGDNADKTESVTNDNLLSVRCCLQFLSNSMVDNVDNADEIVTELLEDLHQVVLQFGEDEKTTQFVAMVLHLAMKTASVPILIPEEIIDHFLTRLELEFVVYAMESYVQVDTLAEQYGHLCPSSRIRLLNFLIARNDLIEQLNETMISTLKSSFIERSDFILRSKLDDRDNIFSWEISVLLEALCCISLNDNGQSIISDPVLVTTAAYLLKQIDDAGKMNPEDNGTNVFSVVEDLDKLTSRSTETEDNNEIRGHPTFQFKANLIRLLGNVSYRNLYNQNRVRELGVLPIILNSCKLDARNPFIAQWAVLAIRNLCEGNDENQQFIKQVQRVDTENTLPKLDLINLSS